MRVTPDPGASSSRSNTSRSAEAPASAPIRADPNGGLGIALLHWIYDAAWWFAILVGSPVWLWKALRKPGFRTMVSERLGWRGWPEPSARPRVLIHGVSVGEVKGAQALIDRLREQRSDLEVVLTATTDTGMEMARKLYPDVLVARYPLDLSPVVRRFFRRVQPVAVVLVELEVWPNFLREANRRGAPLAVINGRITEESFKSYRVFKRFFPQFNRLSLVCVQDDTYGQRFRRLGVEPSRVLTTGNVKFDGLSVGRKTAGADLAPHLGRDSGRPVVVLGSSHEPEELQFTRAWAEHFPQARLVLVPRHPPRVPGVAQQLAGEGWRVQRLTELRASGAAADLDLPLVVDTIGELESVYGAADLVFMGGSLIDHGGHNMHEPAVQGVAVVFGPHVHNFRAEVRLLLDVDGALQLDDPERLGSVVAGLLDDPERRQRMGAAAQAAVEAQKGATDLTFAALSWGCLPG